MRIKSYFANTVSDAVQSARQEMGDDAMLVERIGCEITVVPGEPSNLKLTEPGDLALLEAWLHAPRGEG